MILAAIFILLLFSIIIFVLSRIESKPGFAWFVAIGGGLVAWILVLLSYPKGAILIQLTDWSDIDLFFSSPALLLDRFSWPFAAAVSTLLISVLFTDIARIGELQPISWSIDLAITGLGLLSILSANPMTFALTWGILDLVEILTRFLQATNNDQRGQVVVSLSARILGSMLMIFAMFGLSSSGVDYEFPNLNSQVAGYFILAAVLRLDVLPPQAPFLKDLSSRRSYGTQTRLIPVAASLILLTRVAVVGANPQWSLVLMIAAAMAVLFGALVWVWAQDELDGRPFWILSLSAFVVVASVRSNLLASQAWGLSLIFSGGVLFLYSSRDRRLLWLPLLGILGFTALPYTPAWFGLSIFQGENFIFSMVFGLGLMALVFGYAQHMMSMGRKQETLERWMWLVYPLGLAVLPLTHFWVIWSIGGIANPPGGIRSLHWWVGLIVLVPVGILLFFKPDGGSWSQEIRRIFSGNFSLTWVYRVFWWIYRTLSIIVNYFLKMLEEDGGVLWAVLIMILLFALLGRSMGGI